MKRIFFIALALIFSVRVVDVGVQSFLKMLEKTVKKEVEKQVDKGTGDAIYVITGQNSQAQQT